MRTKLIGATLALLMTSGAAMADECDTMAAKIAENVGWRVCVKTQRRCDGVE